MERVTGLSQDINVEGAPLNCSACRAALCIRKQVINLALGNTQDMKCLVCLGLDSNQPAKEVLRGIKTYIGGRECFRKQWHRYESLEFCPDPQGCFPDTCFDS